MQEAGDQRRSARGATNVSTTAVRGPCRAMRMAEALRQCPEKKKSNGQ